MINVSRYLKKGADLELCLSLLEAFKKGGTFQIDFGGVSGSNNVDRAANAMCSLYTVSTPEELRGMVKAVHMPSSSQFAKSISAWKDYVALCQHVGVFPWSIIQSILSTRLSHDQALVGRLAQLLSISISMDAIDSRWRKDEGGVSGIILR